MKLTALFLTTLLLSATVFSQTIPELVFKNPVLIKGTAGQDGAKYRFSNVTTGTNALDAIVEIKGRSASDVILKNIDSTGIGWDKAFQPTLGILNVGKNREWWMEFKMEFVKAGNNDKKTIDTFYVTGLDIDGDNGHLSEWAEMKKAKQVQVGTTSFLATSLLSCVADLLDFDNDGNDYRINGPVTNYTSIDTGSTAVMATYKYAKKDKIEFKIGGKTDSRGGSSGTGGLRLNSLWFKQFSLTPPVVSLPVKLVSFNAILNKSKVDLKWVTASEKNVSHFSIERSSDGTNYSAAGMVFAYGNTDQDMTYTFSDNVSNVQKGIIYYRLRSVDIDGKSELSEIRIIRIGMKTEVLAITTYPNPVSSELRITVPSQWQGKAVIFEIYNQNGQQVKVSKNSTASQTETISVSDLAKGFYVVKATCESETAQQKIIKN